MRKKYSTWIDSKSLEYHNVQWTEPKESTKAFSKLISPWMTESKKVVDIGCGAGAATAYLALINPKVNFTGLDYEKYLIAEATRRSKSANVKNVDFQVGDIFKLKKRPDVDGVISLQTISWLLNFEKPMVQIFRKINPRWIAVTGLFYDGEISVKSFVTEHNKKRTVNYNTYSINRFRELSLKHGFRLVLNFEFEIPIDIEKPKDFDVMGTYTQKIINEDSSIKRLQISGPLLLNWRTLILEKIN